MDPLSDVTIRRDDPARAEITALIERHLELMRSITPPESVHALGADGLAQPDVTLFSLSRDGEVLAIGALRRVDAGLGEVKAMHTRAEVRGTGAGAALLKHLIEQARTLGLDRLSLETGATAPFAPARRFYARHGFEACGPFADYREDPHSAFMTLRL